MDVQRHAAALLVALAFTWPLLACDAEMPARVNAALRFTALPPFPAGEHPNEIAIGDFDGDGDDDIVTAGLISPSVTFIVNDGAGALRLQAAEPMAAGPLDLAAIELDGSPPTELLISTFEAGQVLVMRWDGHAFRTIQAVDVADEPGYLAIADLDGDGDQDCVVSRARGAEVVFFDNVDGALVRLQGVAVPGRPAALEVADLDGDGQPEVAVVASIGNTVSVLRRSGPTWSVAAAAPTSGWPSSVRAGDIDGDGAPELVGATNLGHTLFVGELDTSAAPWTLGLQEYDVGAGPFDVALADLSGDGRLDAAVTNKLGDAVQIFSGQPPTLAAVLPVGVGPTPIRALELNGDGALDLVVVNAFSNEVTVLLSTP